MLSTAVKRGEPPADRGVGCCALPAVAPVAAAVERLHLRAVAPRGQPVCPVFAKEIEGTLGAWRATWAARTDIAQPVREQNGHLGRKIRHEREFPLAARYVRGEPLWPRLPCTVATELVVGPSSVRGYLRAVFTRSAGDIRTHQLVVVSQEGLDVGLLVGREGSARGSTRG